MKESGVDRKVLEGKEFLRELRLILGYRPRKLELYEQAFRHASVAHVIGKGKTTDSNERLEFLGDAVLDLIIADILFQKYPFQGEGFLTEMRARIVSRDSLSNIAVGMGLFQMLQRKVNINRQSNKYKHLAGNALEALVGAVYVDKGFKGAQKFVVDKIVKNHIQWEELRNSPSNFKGVLIEWSQKEKKEIEFKFDEERPNKSKRIFYKANLLLDGVKVAEGSGYSKKQAEMIAAEKACEILEIVN